MASSRKFGSWAVVGVSCLILAASSVAFAPGMQQTPAGEDRPAKSEVGKDASPAAKADRSKGDVRQGGTAGAGRRGRDEMLAQMSPDVVLPPVMTDQGDKDGDKALSKDELTALADAWYDKLDPDKTGKLTQERFSQKFGALLPSSEQGFGPTLFIAPGLFAAADFDKDGVLTRAEFKQTFANWFDKWDAPKSGSLDDAKLRAGLAKAWPLPRFNAGAGRNALQAEVAKGADFSEKPPVKPLPPEEEAKHFLLPEGYRMELVLAEPDVEEPVAITFDGNGRMYVAEMRSYMQDIDGENEFDPISRVSRHEDADGDGVFDRHTTFIDKLVLPRFAMPWDGDSVLSMETDADDVFKYTDTNGDGVADKKELFYHGAGRRGNLEHQQSGMVWGMDNWIYTTYNAFRLRWTPDGKILREETGANGGQWGLSMDNSGKMMWVEGGGEIGPVNFQQPIVYGAFSLPDEIEKDFRVPWGEPIKLADMQGGMARVRLPDGSLNHFTAVSGEDVFRGHRLPADLVDDWMFGEPVARIVRRTKRVVADGVTQLRNAYPNSEFIRSTDPLFRPVNMATAPDGTLYIVDMYRGIVQEGTFYRGDSYLRKKIQQYKLDEVKRHGRIWRLTYKGIEPDKTKPRMLDESPEQLVAHLEHPNGWHRDTAQRLIVLRQDKSVAPALRRMAQTSSNRLARIHALWTLEGLGLLDADLVRENLKSDDPQMRIQGMRLSESLSKAGDSSFATDVRALAGDSDPNVVIQAMLTLNHLKVPDAATLIRSTRDKSQSKGVREIGSLLLQPPGGRGEFQGFRFTADQRKLLERGSVIYKELCYSCHGLDGQGAPLAGAPAGETMAPPLAGSSRVLGHRDYVVNVLLHGLIGPIEGKSYQSLMAPMGTNDDEWIASVASYVRNSFGNSASVVTPAEAAAARAAASGRTFPWTVAELETTLPGYLRYRPDWKVTASHNTEMAGFGVNGAGFIQWDSGEPQKPGMWFQVELPRPTALGEISLDSMAGFGGATYPRGYDVRVSADGNAWSEPVAAGKGTGPSVRIVFPPVEAKFIRITLTASAENVNWTVQKIRLFEAVKPASPESLEPRVGKLALAEVLDAVTATRGDPQRGRALFNELSCTACHTVRADEPPKGPYLGNISKTYPRRELAEQILAPSKIIAKDYTTSQFALRDGTVAEGFVVRESPHAVTFRTVTAEERTVPLVEIEERKKSEKSIMPEGLVGNLTVKDLASVLDYLGGLSQAPAAAATPAASAKPKHLLVVSVTAGFRHPSIEVGEKVLRELSRRSGEFTLDFASINPGDPKYALTEADKEKEKDKAGAAAAPPRFGPGMILAPAIVSQADKDGDKTLTKEELLALGDVWFDKMDRDKAGKLSRAEFPARLSEVLSPPPGQPRNPQPAVEPQKKSRRGNAAGGLPLGGLVGPGLFFAVDVDKDGSLSRDEWKGAFARWAAEWDTEKTGKIAEPKVRDGLNAALPRLSIPGFERNPKVDAAGRKLLAEKMSPEALKHYDGVIFLNTTGDLPIPDLDAFYKWIEDGHAFIGMHAAADTLHGSPGYAKMLGGEFASHGAQVEVDVLNVDKDHPAGAPLGKSLTVFEEMYLFKNYDRSQVHEILIMDKHPNTEEPGHYPVAWSRDHGKGRVFYTSLGHREDVWDPEWEDRNSGRENPPQVAEAYQKHILGGVRWALGLAGGGAPQRDK